MDFANLNIEQYLKDSGIKPSYQRLRIFEYLIRRRNHPTVDEIYQELIKDIPTLSRTTVYNTLKLFLEKKVVQLISIDENETRYDADIAVHGHFQCEECGKIYDFPIDWSQLKIKGLADFKINEKQVYIKGSCSGCLKKKQ